MVEKVVHINVVDITLNAFEINILGLLLFLIIFVASLVIVFFVLVVIVIIGFFAVVCLLEPLVREDLRNCQSVLGVQFYHVFYYLLCF